MTYTDEEIKKAFDEIWTEIERLKERDPEVYFAVTVLWKIMTSWIWELEEYL